MRHWSFVEVHLFKAQPSSPPAKQRAYGALSPAGRCAFALLLLIGCTCRAQTPAPLSMQQAVDLARIQNPSLLSAQAHVTATKQSETTAGLRVNPNFNLTGSDVSLAANSNNPYFYSG